MILNRKSANADALSQVERRECAAVRRLCSAAGILFVFSDGEHTKKKRATPQSGVALKMLTG